MLLVGAGGHAKMVFEILMQQKIAVDHIYDADPNKKFLYSLPVSQQLPFRKQQSAIIAIGNNYVRLQFAYNHLFDYLTLMHKDSSYSMYSSIGKGSILMAQVAVNADARIGSHCIINTGAVVGHDCIIEDFVHISGRSYLSGGVQVGQGAHVGIGSNIIPGIRIGKWATVGAGSVVLKDVPDFATVVGNPARIVKISVPTPEQCSIKIHL